MTDENLHHAEGYIPEMVVEKPKLRDFTEDEIKELVRDHIKGWREQPGWRTWLRRLIHRFDRRRRHYMRLICVEKSDKTGFDLRIQLGISNRTSVQSQMMMMTAKWMVDMFIQAVARHDARTLEMIRSLPFIYLTEGEQVYGNR